jgi:benzodiazapine receptor
VKTFLQVLRLLGCIVLCEAAGLFGGIFTAQSVTTWYATLAKPSFNPPAWVFGPVWTTLYLLMGISLYLVWRTRGVTERRRTALIVFFVQLILNALWSYIFFGLRNPGAAVVEIFVLWVCILLTAIFFRKLSRPAAWLLVPYILWVTFAAVLNFAVWQLNG